MHALLDRSDTKKEGRSYFYGNCITIAKQFKSDISRLTKSLKTIIRKDYNLATSLFAAGCLCENCW